MFEINAFRVALSSDDYDFAKTVEGRRSSTGLTPSAEYNLSFSSIGVLSYSGRYERNWVKR